MINKGLHWFLALILMVAAWLAFKNLDSAAFWDDEAHVGIMARNYLKTGHLTGWDGRNLFAYRNGGALDDELRPINAPLDIFVCAASFWAFGETTWAGRFLFVVVGLVGIVFAALVASEESEGGERAALFTAALLALSPWYLLYIRQCRYYSLSMTASLVAFWAYQRTLRTRNPAFAVLMTIASVLSFYANPLLCGAFLFSMACYNLAFIRRGAFRVTISLCVAAAAFAAFIIPYAIIHKIWVRPDHLPSSEPWLAHHLKLMWWNLRDLNVTTPMPWVVGGALALVAAFQWRRAEKQTLIMRYGILIVVYIIFVSCFSPQPTSEDNRAEVRYLVPVMPFLAILTAALLARISEWNKAGAAALLAIIVCTNLLTLTPRNAKMRWLLPAYVNEILKPYPTGTSEAVEFLKKNASADDKIFATPDFLNYPIAFYLGDRIRVCCVLNKETRLSSQTVSQLNAPLLVERNSPDWFLAFGKTRVAAKALEYFERRHMESGVEVANEYKEFARLQISGSQTQRPELNRHTFGPPRDFPAEEDVYVYKRNPLIANGRQ